MKSEYPEKQGDEILITDGKTNTSCHSYASGDFGWCKTSELESNREFDNNWGWCQESCKNGNHEASQLQETRLQILPLSSCKKLVTDGAYNFNEKTEICA